MAWFSILDNRKGNPSDSFRAKRGELVGCTSCPLNRPDHPKVKNLKQITGKTAMLWGTFPGRFDEQNGIEFAGREGKFLWKELRDIGLRRSMFDIQNVVRCRPVDDYSREREPTKKELKHCSGFNAEALDRNDGAARLHLVIGKLAHQQLLGNEFKADTPVFWSEKLDARVICLEDLSYFVNAPPWRLELFRERLRAAKYFYDNPHRWHFFKKVCDFKLVRTDKEEQELFNELDTAKSKGIRTAIDVESGLVNGKRQMLTIAFSTAKNRSRCLALHHPENENPPTVKKLDRIRAFMGDKEARKVFQYGCSDLAEFKAHLGVRVRGYDFDTTYAHYFIFPFLRSHGLNAIAGEAYPLYGDYKSMVDVRNLAAEKLSIVALYNNADAALTKTLELDYAPQVPQPLMHTYIWAGITLYKMEERGPVLDRLYLKRVIELIPPRLAAVTRELRLLSGDRDFNPSANEQVAAIIYGKLGLPLPQGEKEGSTGEEVLAAIIQETNHPFPKLILEYRGLYKMKSTYIDAYLRSADAFGGELRTRWYLTGAVTGRLRSGGGKKDPNRVNMQNLHGDPVLQNLLVSDANWREVMDRV